MAMFTLWLMPMSSVRMSKETVCAGATVTKLADSSQLTQVTVRIRRMDGAPVGERYRTRYVGVTCPCRMERQDPYTGSPVRATTGGVCSPRACARYCVWEGHGIRQRREPATLRDFGLGVCDRCATGRYGPCAATARAARRCPSPSCRRTRRARCRTRAARDRDSWRASATRLERTRLDRESWRSNMLCVSFPPPDRTVLGIDDRTDRSEEHTSELQSLD